MKRLWTIIKKLCKLFSLLFGAALKYYPIKRKSKRKLEINKELAELHLVPLNLIDQAKIRRLKNEKREIDEYIIKVAHFYQDKFLSLK